MKRNFLITTGIKDTWEFHEDNFLLGKWCEFYEFNFFDKEKFMKKNLEIKIIKSTDIWDNNEEKCLTIISAAAAAEIATATITFYSDCEACVVTL